MQVLRIENKKIDIDKIFNKKELILLYSKLLKEEKDYQEAVYLLSLNDINPNLKFVYTNENLSIEEWTQLFKTRLKYLFKNKF